MGGDTKLANDKKTYERYVDFLRSYIDFYKESQRNPADRLGKMMDESVEIEEMTEELKLDEAHKSAVLASGSLDRMAEFSQRAIAYVDAFDGLKELLRETNSEKFHEKKAKIHDKLETDRLVEGIPSLDQFMKDYKNKTSFKSDLENYEENIKIAREEVEKAQTVKIKQNDIDVKIQKEKLKH